MAQRKTATKAGGKGRTTKRSTKKAGTKRASRSSSARHTKPTAAAGDEEVSIDRRRTERRGEEEASDESSSQAAPQLERRKKVNRRRQIDPTTCERDYTDEEVEFMNALDDYKRKSGRMFPTCSEVLEVVRGLGYAKLAAAELEALRGASEQAVSATPMTAEWPPTDATHDQDAADGTALADEPQLAY